MKLKIKSLQGSTFTIDAEAADTIATVKSKIESGHGHQAASQKLIYSGKVLTDADTVQSCGVSEKDFFVLMVSKPKVPKAAPAPAAPAPAPATPATPAAASATAEPAAAAPAPSTAAAPATSTATPSAAPTASASSGTSQFLVGSALEEAVNSIVEMGFEKSEVQKAMRASFNNPERAVEYLMTGIPEHLSQPTPAAAPPASGPTPQAGQGQAATAASAPQATAAAAAAAPATPAAPTQAPSARAGNLFEAAAAQAQGGAARRAGGPGGAGAGAGLAGLGGESDGEGGTVMDLGNPAMVAQLRQLVQQNPAALNPLIQALAQSNPRLANAMAEDPEGVLSALAADDGYGEGMDEMTLPGMDELNPEDRTAVEQIIAMGIPENRAIEAYLMCGRNVEMAVQYYFENQQDFED